MSNVILVIHSYCASLLSMHQAVLNVCITGDTNMLINGIVVFICVVHIFVNWVNNVLLCNSF